MLIGCGPDSHHCPQCPLSVEAGLPGGGGGETTSLHGAVRRRRRLTHCHLRHRKRSVLLVLRLCCLVALVVGFGFLLGGGFCLFESEQQREGSDLQTLLRRFWKVAAPYWSSDDKVQARTQLGAVFLLTLATTGISVGFNFLGRDFYNALASQSLSPILLFLL